MFMEDVIDWVEVEGRKVVNIAESLLFGLDMISDVHVSLLLLKISR